MAVSSLIAVAGARLSLQGPLPTALSAQGVDYKQYREGMRKELTLNTLRQRDVISHINVSPRELEQFLTRQQTSAANDEFNVSHILLSLPEAATPDTALISACRWRAVG